MHLSTKASVFGSHSCNYGSMDIIVTAMQCWELLRIIVIPLAHANMLPLLRL